MTIRSVVAASGMFAMWFSAGPSAQQRENPIRSSIEQETTGVALTHNDPDSSLEGSDDRTFAALQLLLTSGQEIVVTDNAGRVRRGKVASISGDRLVMASPVAAGPWEALLPLYWPLDLGVVLKRRIFRSGEQVFVDGSVRRIDTVDPTRNGIAIGAAVGAGFVAAVYGWERNQPESSLKGLATALAVVVAVPTSLRIGHVLDRAMNESIYERHTRSRQVSISPWFGRTIKGVAAHVRF
ncbi:MAG TPA: hypothetical protein VM819_11455 [Vicinamibacterales bacterium]|nr:hypothetical protein [Vicinamibacterales bacterium]